MTRTATYSIFPTTTTSTSQPTKDPAVLAAARFSRSCGNDMSVTSTSINSKSNTARPDIARRISSISAAESTTSTPAPTITPPSASAQVIAGSSSPSSAISSHTPIARSSFGSLSIPLRRSSKDKATAGGEIRRTPRRYNSLSSVAAERRRLPQLDEREWLAGPERRITTSTVKMDSFSSPQDSASMSPPLGADLFRPSSESWEAEKENILKGPFDYLESHPGKDIRSQLIAAFNAWLDVPDSSLDVITRVVAMLHTSSLLIDDVEDNSQLRRGIPVAHSIFGTAQTINSANYVYFCALQELLTLHNPSVIQIYTEELLNLHRGQGMDLFWRDTLTCPAEDDYLEMVGNKTGGLFRLAIKLMCAESPSHNDCPLEARADYVPLVNTIGLLFQILDDYRNLSDSTYAHNKGLCEDLTEGKFSFPIIHAIRADPSNLVLINILKQKTQDEEVKKYAVAYMDRCGSFSYTRRVLRGLTKKALRQVEEVDGGRGRGEGMSSYLERLRVEKHSRGTQSEGGSRMP